MRTNERLNFMDAIATAIQLHLSRLVKVQFLIMLQIAAVPMIFISILLLYPSLPSPTPSVASAAWLSLADPTEIQLDVRPPAWMYVPFPHCQYEFITPNTTATWACRHAVDAEELRIMGPVDKTHRGTYWYRASAFKLTLEFDAALDIRLLLDRCREGYTCADELVVNTTNAECYYSVENDLALLCFDRNYFLQLFKAGPLILRDRISVENFHQILAQYTKSLVLYRILIKDGALIGKYPGKLVTALHPVFSAAASPLAK